MLRELRPEPGRSPVTAVTSRSAGTETVTFRLTFPVRAAASGTRCYLRARAEIQ